MTLSEILSYVKNLSPEQMREVLASNKKYVGLKFERLSVKYLLTDNGNDTLYKKARIDDAKLIINSIYNNNLCELVGNTPAYVWYSKEHTQTLLSRIKDIDFILNYKRTDRNKYALLREDGVVFVYPDKPFYQPSSALIFDLWNLRAVVKKSLEK